MGGVASQIPIVGSLLGGGVHPAEALAMHEHLRKGGPMGRGRKWNTFRKVVLDKHPELMDVPTHHLVGGGVLDSLIHAYTVGKTLYQNPKVKAVLDVAKQGLPVAKEFLKNAFYDQAKANALLNRGKGIRKRRGRGAFISRPRRPPVLLDPDTLKPLPRPKGGRIQSRRGRGFMDDPILRNSIQKFKNMTPEERRAEWAKHPTELRGVGVRRRRGRGVGPVRLNPAYEHSYVAGGLF